MAYLPQGSAKRHAFQLIVDFRQFPTQFGALAYSNLVVLVKQFLKGIAELGNPTLETLEKIAKALDVSIKSLFNDPADVEGFVLLKGKPYHFNSQAEFEPAFKESRPKMGVHCTTTPGDGKS